ncbi:hypothetical protein SDC9_175575 [bioreactor metagenome]|uniref:Uncharacterized protein n=1 Tax=bioreactor metagenome TaxID=1076179 RepID=A0A645GPM5_9ZZZZ
MGWVGDDNIRLGHGLHHAHHGHLPLLLPDTALNLRVALLLLIFQLDLIFGHAQVFFVLPPLVKIIHTGQYEQGQAHGQPRIGNQKQDERPRFPGVLPGGRPKSLHSRHIFCVGDKAYEKDLADGLTHLIKGVQGEDALESLYGIEPVHLGRKSLAGKQESHLNQIDGRRPQEGYPQDRQDG